MKEAILLASAALAFTAWHTAPAWPQDSRTVDHSTVTLAPAMSPAVALVHFDNSSGDGRRSTDTFTLTLGRLSVEITAVVGDAAPDTITVTVPEGYVALPDELTIRDGTAATILIYPLQAVGM